MTTAQDGGSLPALCTGRLYHQEIIIIIIIIIIVNFNWVVTRWQWLFYMYTKYEIDY